MERSITQPGCRGGQFYSPYSRGLRDADQRPRHGAGGPELDRDPPPRRARGTGDQGDFPGQRFLHPLTLTLRPRGVVSARYGRAIVTANFGAGYFFFTYATESAINLPSSFVSTSASDLM